MRERKNERALAILTATRHTVVADAGRLTSGRKICSVPAYRNDSIVIINKQTMHMETLVPFPISDAAIVEYTHGFMPHWYIDWAFMKLTIWNVYGVRARMFFTEKKNL